MIYSIYRNSCNQSNYNSIKQINYKLLHKYF